MCGCDGVTYWNATVASTRGMPVSTTGECVGGKMCGGFANLKCPAMALCNGNLADKTACSASDLGGTCWAMPSMCPAIGIGPTQRACGAAMCAAECDLIKTGATWYEDKSCPQ